MDVFTAIAIIFPIAIWLWLNIIASYSANSASTLDSFQKKAQIIIVWLVPLFGSLLVLYFVRQHEPEAIPRKLIPWPFRGIVFGKRRKPHKHRDENEDSGIDLAVSERKFDHHHSVGGSDGGGSGD